MSDTGTINEEEATTEAVAEVSAETESDHAPTPEQVTEWARREVNQAQIHAAGLTRRTLDAVLVQERDSHLVTHAKRELELAGLFAKDSDYSGAIGEAVMDIIRLVSLQGHSGSSAGLLLQIVTRLMQFATLTPNDHSLNRDVSEYAGQPTGTRLQDIRESNWLSNDGGATWYDVNATEKDVAPDEG